MHTLKRFILIAMAATAALACPAQEPEGDEPQAFNIVEAINSTAGGTVIVTQPMQLNKLTSREGGMGATESKRGLGYRIQVFSDNNVRTAKANAEYRKRTIEAQMPELRGYLTFDSPYWRVKVGDFRTQSEANAALRELKAAFPAFASDFRLIRERINAPQD